METLLVVVYFALVLFLLLPFIATYIQLFKDITECKDEKVEYFTKPENYDQMFIRLDVEDEKERAKISAFLEEIKTKNLDYDIKFINNCGKEMILIEKK